MINRIKIESRSTNHDFSSARVTDQKVVPGPKTIHQIRSQRVKEFYFNTKLSSTLEKVPCMNKNMMQDFENIMAANNIVIEHYVKSQALKIRERLLSRRHPSLNSTGLGNDSLE